MIVVAKLIKRVTADGLVDVKEDIPIGKVYRVETNTRRRGRDGREGKQVRAASQGSTGGTTGD